MIPALLSNCFMIANENPSFVVMSLLYITQENAEKNEKKAPFSKGFEVFLRNKIWLRVRLSFMIMEFCEAGAVVSLCRDR